ncbi:ArdC-like ssDNA-binding domain-containing protein [Chloroflexota bacterium]
MSKSDEQVRQTEPYSVVNNRILRAVCPECTDSRDWKTFKNWQSQNLEVRKGQQGTKIVTLKKGETDNQDDETKGNEFWKLVPLFCRHQVVKKTGKSAKRRKSNKDERN